MKLRQCATLLVALLLPTMAVAASSDRWDVPVEVKKLDNGLTVVVSPDHSAPVVGISLIYHVGMRLEPKGRTGFAHLFEHLMFQGTPKAPKGLFHQVLAGGGGTFNGSTQADFTNYVSTAPVNALEPILWLEADRMKTLDFSPANLKNQQDVVKEEIRINVKNQPYGGANWINIGNKAFDRWENNHDGYGSFEDLEAANIADVQAFHRDYYGPNNAVLSITGDVTPDQAFALAEKYFGAIPARPVPPRSDVREPLNTAERRSTESDAIADIPMLVTAWKVPERGSRDHVPMALLASILSGGSASRLHQSLLKTKQQAVGIDGSIGMSSVWDYDGPTLYTISTMYKPNLPPDAILSTIDEEIAKIAKEGVSEEELSRIKTRMMANWNNAMEPFMIRADVLARLQTIWGDAKVANRVPEWIERVTSDDIKRVAATYLVPSNRTIIDRVPDAILKARAAAPAASATGK